MKKFPDNHTNIEKLIFPVFSIIIRFDIILEPKKYVVIMSYFTANGNIVIKK